MGLGIIRIQFGMNTEPMIRFITHIVNGMLIQVFLLLLSMKRVGFMDTLQ